MLEVVTVGQLQVQKPLEVEVLVEDILIFPVNLKLTLDYLVISN